MKNFTKNLALTITIIFCGIFSSYAYHKPASLIYKASIMARAEENFSNCKYKSALNLYIKLLKIDQNNTSVNFKAGLCCFNLPNSNENAIGYLKRACMSKDTLPEAFFYLGSIYQLEERFDEALQTFNHFLNFVKSNKNGRELRSEVLLRIHMCLAAGDLL